MNAAKWEGNCDLPPSHSQTGQATLKATNSTFPMRPKMMPAALTSQAKLFFDESKKNGNRGFEDRTPNMLEEEFDRDDDSIDGGSDGKFGNQASEIERHLQACSSSDIAGQEWNNDIAGTKHVPTVDMRPSIETVHREFTTEDEHVVPRNLLKNPGWQTKERILIDENPVDAMEERGGAQMEQSGQPAISLSLASVDIMSHEAQLAAAQFLRRPGATFAIDKKKLSKKCRDSMREEEVNETFEEYESQPHNKSDFDGKASGGTSIGLHARMAQLASAGPKKTPGAAAPSKINRNATANLQTLARQDAPQAKKTLQLQLISSASGGIQQNTPSAAVSVGLSRSATCSPAMGGRKTIMNLPSRGQLDHTLEAATLEEHQAPQGTGTTEALQPCSSSQTLELPATSTNAVYQPYNYQVRSQQHLFSISEQNESSKPTSKIGGNGSSVHQFLSSMITMRSIMGANNNTTSGGPATVATQQQIQQQQQRGTSQMSPSSPLLQAQQTYNLNHQEALCASVPLKGPLTKLNEDKSASTKKLFDTSESKKQYPTRVMINLENPQPKPLPPIITSSVETLQSQSQLTVQQKNFTFNETPSSAQNPHIALSLKQHMMQLASSPLNSQRRLMQTKQPVALQGVTQSHHNSLTRSMPLLASNHSSTVVKSQKAPPGQIINNNKWASSTHQNLGVVSRTPGLKMPPKQPKQLSRQPKKGGNSIKALNFKQCSGKAASPIPMYTPSQTPPMTTNLSQQHQLKQQQIFINEKQLATTQYLNEANLQDKRIQEEAGTLKQHFFVKNCRTPVDLPRTVDYFSLNDRVVDQNINTGGATTSMMFQKNPTKSSKKQTASGKSARNKKPLLNASNAGKLAKSKPKLKSSGKGTPISYQAKDRMGHTSRHQTGRLNLLENIIEEQQISSTGGGPSAGKVQIDGAGYIQADPIHTAYQAQQMQTPLFGNRATHQPLSAAMLQASSPSTATRNHDSQQRFATTYQAHQLSLSPNNNTNILLSGVDTPGTNTQKNPFQSYMVLNQQSRLIGQIRKDIQSRKIQQDQRAEILSRILAEQDASQQISLLQGDESSVSLVSRQHRRSLSASLSQSSQVIRRVQQRQGKDVSGKPYYNNNLTTTLNQGEDLINSAGSSFVSSFAYSFVVEKDQANAVVAGPQAFNMMATMPVIGSQQQQRSRTTTVKQHPNAPNANLSAQLQHYLEQHKHHAKQFSYGCYPGAAVSTSSLNALQSYYGGITNAGGNQKAGTNREGVTTSLGSQAYQGYCAAPDSNEALVMQSSHKTTLTAGAGAGAQPSLVTLNQKVMQAHQIDQRYHASSQSQAIQPGQSSQQRIRQHQQSYQNGQTTSSQLDTMRERSSSQINASQVVYQKSFSGQAQSKSMIPPSHPRATTAGAAKYTPLSQSAANQQQFFHQSPIELRSQAADSVNMFALQQDLMQVAQGTTQPFTQRQKPYPSSELKSAELRVYADDECYYDDEQDIRLIAESAQGADQDDIFERESGERNGEEDTVLLETAGFLPLKNICQQLQINSQTETADSQERPSHYSTKQIAPNTIQQPQTLQHSRQSKKEKKYSPRKNGNPKKAVKKQRPTTTSSLKRPQLQEQSLTQSSNPPTPMGLTTYRALENEIFYAAPQQGFVPNLPTEKGVQTTTSFLEVSICRTPTGEPHNRSRNHPIASSTALHQQHSQPLTSSSRLSQQRFPQLVPTNNRLSQTCKMSSECITTNKSATAKNLTRKSTKIIPGTVTVDNDARSTANAHNAKVKTPRTLNSRLILTSGATKTNLKDLPSIQSLNTSSQQNHLSSNIDCGMTQLSARQKQLLGSSLTGLQENKQNQFNSFQSLPSNNKQSALVKNAATRFVKQQHAEMFIKDYKEKAGGQKTPDTDQQEEKSSHNDQQRLEDSKNCQIF